MPELNIDVTVANRFISSLSKSLQALCHGCMDFDSGIEIVGYINVNIDSGSKVDYVLNEKVLKSTTNSMTFVSNSFLARKEQQKQTRDGACSPIAEMTRPPAITSLYASRSRGYLHSLHRGAASVSHSYTHSSQKRSWAGMDRDWRLSPKKQRDGRHSSPHEQISSAQSTHLNPLSSSSNLNLTDPNFKWPETSAQSSNVNDGNPEIQIKKELLEGDNKNEEDQNEQLQTDYDNDNKELTNIKSDPDATTTDTNDETSGQINDPSDDYKNTFLEPSTSDENQDTSGQNLNETNTDDNHSANVSSLHQSQDTAGGEEMHSEDMTQSSEMQVECDDAGEEGTYSQSVGSDAGEGSSDPGQFEVIEIEDEDEDVQAMFGAPQEQYKHMRTGTQHQPPQFSFAKIETGLSNNKHAIGADIDVAQTSSSSYRQQRAKASPVSKHSVQDTQRLYNTCQYCSTQLSSKSLFNRHMTEQHPEQPMSFPYNCAECGRGFFSQSGLNHHIESHFVKSQCSLCDHTFKYSRNLKRHLESNHYMKECRQCKCYISGEEFRTHVLQCTGPPN